MNTLFNVYICMYIIEVIEVALKCLQSIADLLQ